MTTEQQKQHATAYRALATPGRVALIDAMGDGKPVHRIAEEAGVPSHRASEALQVMLAAGLVEYDQRDQSRYYRPTALGTRLRDVMRSREAQ